MHRAQFSDPWILPRIDIVGRIDLNFHDCSLPLQNEQLHKQVRSYDEDRLNSERARMEEQTRRMEVEGKMRILESKALKAKEEDASLIEALEVSGSSKVVR